MQDTGENVRVDILNLEIFQLEFSDVSQAEFISSYYAMGRAHRVRIKMSISEEKEMLDVFYRTIIESLYSSEKISEVENTSDYTIANKARIDSELKDFFIKLILAAGKNEEGTLSEFDYAMVATNRLDFYNPRFSLNNKSLKEKIDVLLTKAKADVNDRYYVPAKLLLEKILILDRDNKEAYALKGACHRELGELEDAEQAFKRWLDLSEPDEPKPYFNYGDILLRLRKYGEAEQVYESYLKVFPDDFDGLLEMSQVSYLQGKDYMQFMQRANDIDPENFAAVLLRNFVFHRDEFQADEGLDLKLAAALIGVQPEYLAKLVDDELVPFERIDNNPIFNINELQEWTGIVNRFKIMNTVFNFNLEEAEKLRQHRSDISENLKMRASIKKKKKISRRQKQKKILEDMGQQTLFEED